MSKRFDRSTWIFIVFYVIAMLTFGAFVIADVGKTADQRSACQDALAAADARYALSESTTALVFDQWRADNLGDAHGVEYAAAGIQQNMTEIDALTTDYNELKKECK